MVASRVVINLAAVEECDFDEIVPGSLSLEEYVF